MKKLLLLLGMTAVFMSCDPDVNVWSWRIKNGTDQALYFEYFNLFSYQPSYFTPLILPGESIVLYEKGHERKQFGFKRYFEESANSYGGDVYWRILSSNSATLKAWSYSDMGLPDQRFFDESEWLYSTSPGANSWVITEFSWTFEILPKDISTN